MASQRLHGSIRLYTEILGGESEHLLGSVFETSGLQARSSGGADAFPRRDWTVDIQLVFKEAIDGAYIS